MCSEDEHYIDTTCTKGVALFNDKLQQGLHSELDGLEISGPSATAGRTCRDLRATYTIELDVNAVIPQTEIDRLSDYAKADKLSIVWEYPTLQSVPLACLYVFKVQYKL
jgi:hypothetical protein